MSATPAPLTHAPRVLLVDLSETRYLDPSELEPAACTVVLLDELRRPWVLRFYGDCGLDHVITPGGGMHDVYTHDGSCPSYVPANLWALAMQALDCDQS